MWIASTLYRRLDAISKDGKEHRGREGHIQDLFKVPRRFRPNIQIVPMDVPVNSKVRGGEGEKLFVQGGTYGHGVIPWVTRVTVADKGHR